MFLCFSADFLLLVGVFSRPVEPALQPDPPDQGELSRDYRDKALHDRGRLRSGCLVKISSDSGKV